MTKNQTRIVVTSFNETGYAKYGKRMISTFREFWPSDIPLIVVSEDSIPVETDDRVRFHDYAEIAPDGVHFKRKFGNFSEANGNMISFNETENGFVADKTYDYRFDAIRFSHKVFSINGANQRYDCDELIWIDGDTLTHTQIDQAFFDSVSPGTGHLSYLGRENNYSECGFMVFNRRIITQIWKIIN